jgi:hypothetical protein
MTDSGIVETVGSKLLSLREGLLPYVQGLEERLP